MGGEGGQGRAAGEGDLSETRIWRAGTEGASYQSVANETMQADVWYRREQDSKIEIRKMRGDGWGSSPSRREREPSGLRGKACLLT